MTQNKIYKELLDKDFPRFTIHDLIQFGNYLFSEERFEAIMDNHEGGDAMVEAVTTLQEVDILNFLEFKRKVASN